jgi:putative spermidine/putrescine transport system ATP-binding protein/spermidine/putrescine transport system ATP-binding protein
VVDLFVRPEDLRVAENDAAVAAHGIVAAQIYQGGHVDIYVDAPEVASGRVLLRVPGREGMSLWSPGTRISIALTTGKAIAFRATASGQGAS